MRSQFPRLLVELPGRHVRDAHTRRKHFGIKYVDHFVRLDVDVDLIRGLFEQNLDTV